MSMSRKGTSSDNALIELYHSSLKSETFYLYPEPKSSNKILSQTVLDYIDYYNEDRIQEKLKYLSPSDLKEFISISFICFFIKSYVWDNSLKSKFLLLSILI